MPDCFHLEQNTNDVHEFRVYYIDVNDRYNLNGWWIEWNEEP